MSIPQVGQGAVAVVPTFTGFRKAVNSETDAAAKSGGEGFKRAFGKTGQDSGKQVGTGFKAAFDQQSAGFSDKATRDLEANVTKATRALSTARLKEQDLAGKVRVAEAQLAEARAKYASDSSQTVRAQERLESSTRALRSAQETTQSSTDDLRAAQGRLAAAADSASQELAQAGSRGARGFREGFLGGFSSLKAGFIGVIGALGLGRLVSEAVSTAKDFVTGAITIASDLNESVNAVQVAYGDASKSVLALGDNSAKAFGLSQRELNSYATQFSAFVQGIAGPGGDVAGTLQQLIGRGTDFASVFNLKVADALQVFQSGLAGETEPLRKYGIDLSAAAVEAFALSSGLVSASVDSRKVELAQNALTRATEAYGEAVRKYGEQSSEAAAKRDAVTRAEMGVEAATGGAAATMTEAQKVQARYGLLMQQTAKVQGDFANTSDELANKNRINAAAWDDIQAKIGTGFLPVAQQLANIVGNDLLPVIGSLAETEGPALAAAFRDALPAFVTMAKELLPQLPGLFTSVADSLPALIGAAQVLVPLLLWAAQNGANMTTTIGAFFDLITGNRSIEEISAQLTQMNGFLGDVYRGAVSLGAQFGAQIGLMMYHARAFVAEVSTNVNLAVGFVQSLPDRIAGFFSNAGSWLVSSGRALIGGFIDGINQMFRPVGDAVSGIMSWVQGFFPHSPAKRGPFSGSGWTDLPKSGAAVMTQWSSGFVGSATDPFALSTLMATPSITGASSPSTPIAASDPLTPEQRVVIVIDGREFDGYVKGQAAAVFGTAASPFAGGRRG